jgi:alkylhydroperoxidase/carboxymuconolactone decarboxylase family protein YurZ
LPPATSGSISFPLSPWRRRRSNAEAQRATFVQEQFGSTIPGVVQYTTDVLFRDLWLRPDIALRDRSLVTISALIANGTDGAAYPSPQQGDGLDGPRSP